MPKIIYYVFTFADGFRIWSRGLSETELMHRESEHGKLISKEKV